MDGGTLPDLADFRAFHGACGCELRDGPEELSVRGAEGEGGHPQSPVFLITPQGDGGTRVYVANSGLLYRDDMHTGSEQYNLRTIAGPGGKSD